MAKSNFENLQVYQLAEKLADNIWNIVLHWEEFPKATIGKQIVRSVDSIGANIVEGCGRYNFQDNRRFVRIARGSLNETRHWLRRAYKRNLLTNEEVNRLKPIIEELSPKVQASLNSIGNLSGKKSDN
ncbi:MAG: four helix bundle protein, partial [Dolichospermum sp.]